MVYLYLLKEGDEEGGEDGNGAGEQDPPPWLMVYLYLLKERDEEGGEDGNGAGEQDPLPLGPLQVQEPLRQTVLTLR
jgi:hypothetical protein